jgi:hypothetical protein
LIGLEIPGEYPAGQWLLDEWLWGRHFASAFAAAAKLALTEQKYKPIGWNGADYTAVVTNDNNYLLSQAARYINVYNDTRTAPPIPIPGTVGLLGTGILGLLGAAAA